MQAAGCVRSRRKRVFMVLETNIACPAPYPRVQACLPRITSIRYGRTDQQPLLSKRILDDEIRTVVFVAAPSPLTYRPDSVYHVRATQHGSDLCHRPEK